MKVTVVNARDLSAAQEARWNELQQADSSLASPYLCPEFTKAVAFVRDDVYIAIMMQGGDTVGFFPFQRERFGIGKPVGGRLSDFQGAVVARGAEWSPDDLIRGCGLNTWDFHHLIAAQGPFRPYHQVVSSSPFIDLSHGYEVYREEQRRRGSRRIGKLMGLSRKLEREIGPLRFEARTDDETVLAKVIAWKSAQCRRTGVYDFFGVNWTVSLIRRIHQTRTLNFSGCLSALYAGNQLVAAHMGMRSHLIWHYWFPAYDRAFSRYSPGSLLLMKLVEHCATQGIEAIDLGKGEDAYKSSFMSGSVEVAEGSVTLPSILAVLRRVGRLAADFLRDSPLARPISVPMRRLGKAHRKISTPRLRKQ